MRKVLVVLSVAWIAVSLAAAWVSVDRRLAHDLSFLDEPGRAGDIGHDWLLGWGSGLAVPMWAVAAMALATALSTYGGGGGRLGALLVALVAGGSIGYTFANRPATQRLRELGGDGVEAWLLLPTLVLAGLLVLLGLVAWATIPRDAR